jgi:hypothetical protein
MLPLRLAGGTKFDGSPAGLTLRQAKLIRWGELQTERSTWLNRYRDITQYLLPFAGRYFTQDRNRGDKTFNSIYDSTATRALASSPPE